MNSKTERDLVLIFGDQLGENISSLENLDKKHATILMMEVKEEATYVQHHPHKIIFIFSAMRHFAKLLEEHGYNVIYIEFNDKNNQHNFTDNLKQVVNKNDYSRLLLTEPSEFRVLEMVNHWQKSLSIPVEILEDNRFIASIKEFKDWASDKKTLIMEGFYRNLRKKTGILMEDDKPVGGKWNYDSDNRKPPKQSMHFPKPMTFSHDAITQDVIELVRDNFSDHFGDIDTFNLAVTRRSALAALNHFVKENLADFGAYQDAMLDGEYHLHHSLISQYLNVGLLTPLEVIEKVEQAYYDKQVPINSAEGYIRQILGWREYVRGIYWLHMPEYAKHNKLQAKQDLPSFYWTGDTKMQCMKQVILQTKQTANSHHIQRLMVTGNFALLYGVLPEQICKWYLEVYSDAFEWVELPNTLGMSQYADGGVMASKPYAASGNYINKMSNFCKSCHYDVREKTTEKACPFNYLYWDFLINNQSRLESNPRMKFPYKHVAGLSDEQKKRYQELAKQFRDACG